MKNHWKRSKSLTKCISKILILVYLAMLCSVSATAKNPKQQDYDIYELTLDENLTMPKVPTNTGSKVAKTQYALAVELKSKGYDTELLRNNEVIVVTIPSAKLFAPNDTALLKEATTVMRPLLKYLNPAGNYKYILVMHGDDTGSDSYMLTLTRGRVNSIYDWFYANGSVDYVVPYALGSSDPLYPNDSMSNRGKNRRLEIFIVPEKGMLSKQNLKKK